MNETAFETIASAASVLKVDFSAEEFAGFVEDHGLSEDAIEAVRSVFSYLKDKKQPHRNLAFIGPAGTGKTHLAQAFGYSCCQHGMKTYFIKASELRDRFTAARRTGKTDSCLSGLVRPSCLIIDEIGHCAFDKENTRLFFDLIDRRYNKEGNFNMIFTSNKNPALWREDFDEDATLLCALDRIFDDATVFKLRGESFRGKKLETVSLQTGKVQAVEPVPTPDE